MTVPRLFAILFIFCGTAVAWFTLGFSVVERTGSTDSALAAEVAQLWGGRHVQVAPDAYYEVPRVVEDEVQERDVQGNLTVKKVRKTVMDRFPLPLTQSRVDVALRLDQRCKGLLWYATYAVDFDGRYRVKNTDAAPHQVFVHFSFPAREAIYDAFSYKVAGLEAPMATDMSAGLITPVTLEPGAEVPVTVSYRSRGLSDWTYAFAQGVAQVKDFDLSMATDFRGIDFPPGSMSPVAKEATAGGWKLSWRFESLVTGQTVGMVLPNRLNPGPVASRITFFAPVSLLFFLTVMVILGLLKGESLHPMNYFFVSAAFFAFHLLLAYLADQIDINAAFAISAVTSILLVVSYLRLVAGMRFALLRAGLAQLVYLVLFSYAFFFEGYTGLTVTIGSVLTLFVLMQLTGRVSWTEVFSRRRPAPAGGANVDLAMP